MFMVVHGLCCPISYLHDCFESRRAHRHMYIAIRRTTIQAQSIGNFNEGQTKAAKGDKQNDIAVQISTAVVNRQMTDLHLAQEHAIAV